MAVVLVATSMWDSYEILMLIGEEELYSYNDIHNCMGKPLINYLIKPSHPKIYSLSSSIHELLNKLFQKHKRTTVCLLHDVVCNTQIARDSVAFKHTRDYVPVSLLQHTPSPHPLSLMA